MYAGDKFGKQVVTEAVPLFDFDVVNKALSFDWVFVERGGIYVFCVRAHFAVFKHSAEKVDLTNWAESFLFGCLSVVQSLVDNPHICEQGEEYFRAVNVSWVFQECDGVCKRVSTLVFKRIFIPSQFDTFVNLFKKGRQKVY